MSDEVTFEYVKGLKNDQSVLLIDVREPSELEQTGNIPGSINIPLATLEDTLEKISDDDFQSKFKRCKPSLQTEIVFSCRSGRRSLAALNMAKNLGFVNAKHFPGGWLGWENQLTNE